MSSGRSLEHSQWQSPRGCRGMPENAQEIPQAIASTMPSQCHQQIHPLVFIWETRLWFSKMENTTLVFLKGKCTHGFLSDKPSRRHNGPQNAFTVFRGINPFSTLTTPSTPLQTSQNENQRITPLVFFVFLENFHTRILTRNPTISCNHTFLLSEIFQLF